MTDTQIPPDYALPCDVRVPPATVIRAGCSLRMLLVAMEADYRPRHFDATPSSLPAVEGEQIERVAAAIQASAAGLDSDPSQRSWAECNDGTKDNFRRHARNAIAAMPAQSVNRDEAEAREAVSEAVDLLRHYAEYIRTVKADEFERHPYLPLIEQVVDSLTAASPSQPLDRANDEQRACNDTRS
jgi:hypothetical protein